MVIKEDKWEFLNNSRVRVWSAVHIHTNQHLLPVSDLS